MAQSQKDNAYYVSRLLRDKSGIKCDASGQKPFVFLLQFVKLTALILPPLHTTMPESLNV